MSQEALEMALRIQGENASVMVMHHSGELHFEVSV